MNVLFVEGSWVLDSLVHNCYLFKCRMYLVWRLEAIIYLQDLKTLFNLSFPLCVDCITNPVWNIGSVVRPIQLVCKNAWHFQWVVNCCMMYCNWESWRRWPKTPHDFLSIKHQLAHVVDAYFQPTAAAKDLRNWKTPYFEYWMCQHNQTNMLGIRNAKRTDWSTHKVDCISLLTGGMS